MGAVFLTLFVGNLAIGWLGILYEAMMLKRPLTRALATHQAGSSRAQLLRFTTVLHT
jgi:hypothetical protein